MTDQDLSRLEDWLGQALAGFSPAQRKRAALKMMRALRRSNLARIAKNVQPDGSAMTPRRPRVTPDGRKIRKGKMFRGLRFARNWKIRTDADGGELFPANRAVDRVAAAHHFGETDIVGKLRDGRTIRHKYAQRQQLGFDADDDLIALDIAAEMFDLR